MRYGVIGTGSIVEKMIAGAGLHPELTLTAVCSRSEARGRAFADRFGARWVYTDPLAMAEDTTVDMVYIASPNRCHAAQCRMFLENGKHVLCEKPLMADPAELLSLQQLAKKKGLLFREAILMLYQPQKAILRDAAAKCGRISLAHFDYCQLSSKYEALCRGELPNIFNPALHTGALMDLGVYCVYPAIWLFGEPDSVTASATFLESGADGAGAALLHYPDKQVVLTYSKIGQSAVSSQIVGNRGTVTVDRISLLHHMAFTPFGGDRQVLFSEEERPVTMGREIAAFAAQAADGAYDDEPNQLALSVCRCLADIRRAAGITFPDIS